MGSNITNFRSRAKIITSILEVTGSGETKNRIRCRAFLSPKQLKAYLELMLKEHLIEYNENMRKLMITKHGIKFLEFNRQFGKLFEILEHY